MQNRRRSCSIERKLTAYPKPKYYEMVVADSFIHYSSYSKKISEILENHYNALPESRQRQLTEQYKKLTPEQIKSHSYISKHDY